MAPNLKDRVESSLHEIRYHPDFAIQAQKELVEMAKRHKETGSSSMKNDLRSYAIDAILMQETYFRSRLEFLSRLVETLGERSETTLEIADDGCGSGVDLHVLNALLAKKVSLTGIDKDPISLERARLRVPNAKFMADFNEATYDVIYADYVSPDDNLMFQVGTRGEKNFNALRASGIVLQNVDMIQLGLYLRLFGRKFARVLPAELLATVNSGPDCYLCRFEKD